MGGDGDNKNLIMAVVLSFVVIFSWQMLFVPEPPPVDPAAVANQSGAVTIDPAIDNLTVTSNLLQ